jgi:hypothetical protein
MNTSFALFFSLFFTISSILLIKNDIYLQYFYPSPILSSKDILVPLPNIARYGLIIRISSCHL